MRLPRARIWKIWKFEARPSSGATCLQLMDLHSMKRTQTQPKLENKNTHEKLRSRHVFFYLSPMIGARNGHSERENNGEFSKDLKGSCSWERSSQLGENLFLSNSVARKISQAFNQRPNDATIFKPLISQMLLFALS